MKTLSQRIAEIERQLAAQKPVDKEEEQRKAIEQANKMAGYCGINVELKK